jgi:2-amino-4-hydroxy-6-hydroxymethyldihydropteridine diphosphokinase/dihydroneopterin aldolase
LRDSIELRGVRLAMAVGGVAEPVEVDLVLSVDLGDASISDRLVDTVDYGAVVAKIAALGAGSEDMLLERFAGRVADVVLGFALVEEVEVCVRKMHPPVPVDVAWVGVSLRRARRGRAVARDGSHRAIVALGSNLGDRVANLKVAVRALEPMVAQSQVYETPPVGGPGGQDAFLNMVVIVETTLDPFAFLNRCQRIEAAAHRERVVHWGPRTLDVDILFFDDMRIDSAELMIPHPRYAERRFVLAPLAEVAPDRVPDRWDELLEPLDMRILGRVDLM